METVVPFEVAVGIIAYVVVMGAAFIGLIWWIRQPKEESPLVRFMAEVFDGITRWLINLLWHLTKPLRRSKGKHRGR